MKRRHLFPRLAALAALGALAGCGFRLRGSYTFRFRTLAVVGSGPVAQELRLALEGAGVQVLDERSRATGPTPSSTCRASSVSAWWPAAAPVVRCASCNCASCSGFACSRRMAWT